MKTIAQQNFDIILKDCFHALLKPLGFKKKGSNFYRQLAEIGQIITVGKSPWYSKDHIKFSITTGLFIPEFYLTYWTFHDGKIPAYPRIESTITQSLGELTNNNSKKSFDIQAHTDLDELKKEMLDNIINYIIPYFEKIKTKFDVGDLLLDERIKLDFFARLIIFGEYKQFDKAQIEYTKLSQLTYFLSNSKSTLHMYRDKYNLHD